MVKKEKMQKKERAPKKKHVQLKDVKLSHSIRFRLVSAFLVPVVGIVILGTVSYKNASNAMVESYKESAQQSITMLGQYMNLVIGSEKDEFKSYIGDSELGTYLNGLADAKNEVGINKTYTDKLRNKLTMDSKIKSVYFLADEGRSVSAASVKAERDAYSAYAATAQGTILDGDKHSWYLFGMDEDTDTAAALETDNYSLRLAKRMNDSRAVLLVNLDGNFTRKAMQSLDAGENGYVVLISSDGKEFYSDEELVTDGSIVYGTDFYQMAAEAEEETGSSTVTIDGAPYLFVYDKLSMGEAMVCMLIPEDILLAQTNSIKSMSLILTLLAAAVAMLLGTVIARSMAGTISYILRQLQKVAKGDLTVHLTTKRKDELGLLCDGVNDTVAQVKALIIDVNDVSAQLNHSASYVSQAASTFVETSQDIQNAVSEIEVGVNKLDSGSEDCLSQMDSLSGKITNVSANADEIGKLTSSTGTTINSGIESVQGLTESAKSTTEITQNVITAIGELEDKSRSISTIVSAINDIAEQTNLLSLNASIEAARAGEAGKGFAVVAEEIRKLSDQCSSSAGQISDIVNEMVEQTKDVVGIAKKAADVVSTQSGAVEETTQSFKMIDKQVESLLAALATISSNVADMNSSREETLEAIESISAVSAETAACSSTVYTSAGSQLDAVKDLDKAAQELHDRSGMLAEILSAFTV